MLLLEHVCIHCSITAKSMFDVDVQISISHCIKLVPNDMDVKCKFSGMESYKGSGNSVFDMTYCRSFKLPEKSTMCGLSTPLHGCSYSLDNSYKVPSAGL